MDRHRTPQTATQLWWDCGGRFRVWGQVTQAAFRLLDQLFLRSTITWKRTSPLPRLSYSAGRQLSAPASEFANSTFHAMPPNCIIIFHRRTGWSSPGTMSFPLGNLP